MTPGACAGAIAARIASQRTYYSDQPRESSLNSYEGHKYYQPENEVSKSLRGWKGDFQEQWGVPLDVVRKFRRRQMDFVERVNLTEDQKVILETNTDGYVGSVVEILKGIYAPRRDMVGNGMVGDEYSGLRWEGSINGSSINLRMFQDYFERMADDGIKKDIVEANAFLEYFRDDNEDLLNRSRDALTKAGFVKKETVRGD